MTKTNQTIDLYRGESKTVFVAISNEDGSPLDPAGADFKWRLAKTKSSDAIIEKRMGAGLVLVNGGVDIILEPSDTYDLVPELYHHELRVYLGSTGQTLTTVGTAHIRAALDMRQMPTGQAKRKGAA